VEAGSNTLSEKYFKVKVLAQGSDQEEEWQKIESIRLAGPYEKVFEVIVSSEAEAVILKFGDGLTGLQLPKG
jgi:hypothetical protein